MKRKPPVVIIKKSRKVVFEPETKLKVIHCPTKWAEGYKADHVVKPKRKKSPLINYNSDWSPW